MILFYSTEYTLCSMVFVTGAYSSSAIRLIYFFRKYHRLEFHEHKGRMVKLFVFTAVSLVLTLVTQIFSVFVFVCSPGYGRVQSPEY